MNQIDSGRLSDGTQAEHDHDGPYAAAMRATQMPMIITDPRQSDNPIVFVNKAFETLTGYARDEIIGRNCRFLQGPGTDRATIDRLRSAISEKKSIQVDLLNYRKDGSTFWNALYVSPTCSDEGELEFFFASQLDVTDRVEAQRLVTEQKSLVEAEVRSRTAELLEALEMKTLLLHEVDHRVKNNLTMIGSLIRLQSRTIVDPEVVNKLDAMLERVDALATVHRQLYQSDNIGSFDVGAFTASLVADVIGSSGRTDIKVATDIERVEIPSTKAAPFGLIINELITNAIKHAFADGRSGLLQVSAKARAAEAFISVKDDGCGMTDRGVRGNGLGRILVTRLSRQVNASIVWADASPGTEVTVTFPIAS
jgi:PAS domain S-box-containing protein